MLDPYLKWLGIRDPERPPNHYRLLGIDLFEADLDVIATAADRQMAHLRRYQTGPHVELSQRLLNEIAAARLCLLQPDCKRDYDAQLQRSGSHAPSMGAENSIRVVPEPPASARVVSRRRSRAARRFGMLVTLLALPVIVAAAYWLTVDRLPTIGWWASGKAHRGAPVAAPEGNSRGTNDTLAGANGSDGAVVAGSGEPPERETGQTTVAAGDPLMPGPQPEGATLGPAEATTGTGGALGVPTDSESHLGPRVAAPRGPAPPAATHQAPPPPDPSDPWFAVLMAARQRDVETAWNCWRQQVPAAQTPSDRWQAESLGLCLERWAGFWRAVEAGGQAVVVGDALALPEGPAMVMAVSPGEVTVQAGEGPARSYRTAPPQLAPAMAEALARYALQDRPALADAMAAAFWEIDAEGDLDRARTLWALAVSQGVVPSSWNARDVAWTPRDAALAASPAPQPSPQAPPQAAAEAAAPPAASAPAERALGRWTLPTRSLAVGERLPVPEEDALAGAAARIRESDANYLAEPNQPAEQAARARVWLVESGNRLADAAGRYLLLTRSRHLALAAGAVDTACEATEMLAVDFSVDADALRADCFRQLARHVSSRRDQLVLAEWALGAIYDGIHRQAFDAAQELADQLARMVRRIKVTTLVTHATHLARDIPLMRQQYELLADRWRDGWSQEDRARAHQEIGEFLLYYARDGGGAMKFLAEGTDPTLSPLAQRELARAVGDVTERLKVLDGWWAHAGELKGLPSRSVVHYVGAVYVQLLPELAGLERTRVEKRLQEVLDRGELSRHQLLLQNVVDQVWRIEWSAAHPAWQRVVFLEGGVIEIQSQGKRAQHRWQRNVASIEVLGNSGAHRIFLYPVSRQQVTGKKHDAKSGRHLSDGVGRRLAAF